MRGIRAAERQTRGAKADLKAKGPTVAQATEAMVSLIGAYQGLPGNQPIVTSTRRAKTGVGFEFRVSPSIVNGQKGRFPSTHTVRVTGAHLLSGEVRHIQSGRVEKFRRPDVRSPWERA